MTLPSASSFAALPFAEREAIISYLAGKYGWSEQRTIVEAEGLDHVGLAYLKREMRAAEGCGGHFVDHDPGADMFKAR